MSVILAFFVILATVGSLIVPATAIAKQESEQSAEAVLNGNGDAVNAASAEAASSDEVLATSAAQADMPAGPQVLVQEETPANTSPEESDIIPAEIPEAVPSETPESTPTETSENAPSDIPAEDPAAGPETGSENVPSDVPGTDPSAKPVVDPAAYPAQSFSGTAGEVTVAVEADAGAFPAKTTMTVQPVADQATIDQIAGAVDGNVSAVRAVDITFFDESGQPVEPLIPIRVMMAAPEDETAKASANTRSGRNGTVKKTVDSDTVVVHLENTGAAQIVDHQATAPEAVGANGSDTAVAFSAGAFSVYAVVYTVDFHYAVNGKTYEFSLEGGAGIGLKELLRSLNIVETSEIGTFVDEIENVVFSDPQLIHTTKVEETTAVGTLIDELGLSVEYSANLTEDDIEELKAKEIEAPDWALLTLKAFDTVETLTVTMKDGAVFVIKVTDAQAIDALGLDKQNYVIATAGYAMKAEEDGAGQLESHAVDNDLGDIYNWKTEYDVTAFDSTGGYYLSTVEGKYIKVDEANYISLVEDKAEATPFKVEFDSSQLETDTHAKGRYRFSTSADGSTGFLEYRYSHFGIAESSSDTCWMLLRDPVQSSSAPGYVGTWDIIGDGIVLKMYDYSGTVNGNNIDRVWGNSISESDLRSGTGINNGRGLLFTGSGMNGLNGTTVSKPNQFTGEWGQDNNAKVYNKMANQGIVKQTLNAQGYPVLQNAYWQSKDRTDQGSLGYLFGASNESYITAYEGAGGKGLQGLLRKDADGYYYYDSEWNYARMNEDNTEILLYSDTYKKDKETDGHERKEKIGFFPFSNYDTSKREEKCPQQYYYDHQFGTSMHTDFFYPTGGIDPETGLPMRFEFSGDDDVWVFVDGVLVLDMGGVHQPVKGVIDFSTRTSTVYEYDYNGRLIETVKTFDELFAGSGKTFSTRNMSQHSLDFFYLERGGCDSNCAIKFNLLVTETLYLKKEIQGLDLLPEEERARYKDLAFTYELNMRDAADPDKPPFSLFETADTENTDATVNNTVRLDADGNIIEQGFPIKNGQITIKDGETIAISKLAPSMQYYVSEEITEVLDSFSKPLAVNKKNNSLSLTKRASVYYGSEVMAWKTGNQNLKTNNTVKYINRIPETNLDVVKDWKDGQTVDHAADIITFTVSATIPGEGAGAEPVPYPVSAIDGKTFTLTANENWRKAINHLPDKTPDGKQITYTVKEQPVSGYVSSVKVTQSPEEADDKRVEYKIENSPFRIKVKKNWVGDWPEEDKAKVTPITVTLKRYKLQDKENLIIHSGYEVIMPDGMTAESFTYHADYQVLDEGGNVVAEVSSGGEDIILSLPDGTYSVVQTTTDPDSGYDITHTPESRTISGLTVTSDSQTEADFSSIYTRQTGILTVLSSVTDETGTFDADYVVYDENGQEVGRTTYAKAKDGKNFTLPTGTYRVVETVSTSPASSTLRSQSVDPENATVVLGNGESKPVTFTRVYERILDSNNTFIIYHYNYGFTTLASGSIPANYPAGSTIRLTFYCNNPGWHDRDVKEAKYNGQTMTLQHGTGYLNGQNYAMFWLEYTLVQDKQLEIKINADQGNSMVANSVRIDLVSSPSNTNAVFNSPGLRSARKASGLLRSPYVSYQERELTNSAADPVPEENTKKYVLDSWSQEVQLTAGENWEKIVGGLDACDANGNLYYYFIESATEPNLRIDAEAVIDKDGQNKLLVSQENSDTPLTLSNTVYPGALMITKAVEVNHNEPTASNAALTNGTYVFEIKGVAGTTAESISRTVTITFENGKAVSYQISGQDAEEVSGSDNTWAVLVTNLPVGDYTVTEKSSDHLILTDVTGGSSVSNNVATLTVNSRETTPSASAQVVFTNNIDTTSLSVEKVWTDEDDVDHSNDVIHYDLYREPYVDETTVFEPEVVENANGYTGSLSAPAWSETVTDLPKSGIYTPQGGEPTAVFYRYYIAETPFANYKSDVSGGENNSGQYTFTVTNEPYGTFYKDTEVGLEKDWEESDGTPSAEDAHDQDTIAFRLTQKKYPANLYPVKINLINGDGQLSSYSRTIYMPADSILYLTASSQSSGHRVRVSGMNKNGDLLPNKSNYLANANGGKEVTFRLLNENDVWAASISGSQWVLNMSAASPENIIAEEDLMDHVDTSGDPVATTDYDYSMLIADGKTVIRPHDGAIGNGVGDETVKWTGEVDDLPLFEKDETDSEFYVYVYEISEIKIGDSVVTPLTDGGPFKGETGKYLVNWTQNADETWTITNRMKQVVDVTLKKVDKDDLEDSDPALLQGASFTITKYTDNTFSVVDTSDPAWPQTLTDEEKPNGQYTLNGVFEFKELPVGFFKIHEEAAPEGYVSIDDDPAFEITSDLSIIIYEIDGEGVYQPAEENQTGIMRVSGDSTLVVGNTPGAALPNAGGSGTGLFTIIGSLMALLAGAAFAVRRRRFA